MAEHGSSSIHSGDLEAHRATYEGFIKGAVALALISFLVLVALVAFRFAGTGSVILGFGGLILGILAVLIDARAGNRWFLSGGFLVLFGLVTAVLIS